MKMSWKRVQFDFEEKNISPIVSFEKPFKTEEVFFLEHEYELIRINLKRFIT